MGQGLSVFYVILYRVAQKRYSSILCCKQPIYGTIEFNFISSYFDEYLFIGPPYILYHISFTINKQLRIHSLIEMCWEIIVNPKNVILCTSATMTDTFQHDNQIIL